VGNQDNQDIQNTQETQEEIVDKCTICYEDYDNGDHKKVELCVSTNGISHFVCKSCIAQFKSHNTTGCPICRKYVFPSLERLYRELFPNLEQLTTKIILDMIAILSTSFLIPLLLLTIRQ